MLQFGNLYYNPKVVCAYTQNENSIYNSLNDFEKIILNAEDYDNLTKVAPKFKNEIFIRQFSSIKTIFKAKGKMSKLLSYEQYNKIYETNKALNNTFILSLLDWNKTNIFKKYKIYYWYFTHKLIRKLILIRKKFKKGFKKICKI